MKINFKKFPVKNIEDKTEEVDIAKMIGNAIYLNAKDIADADLGHEIYHKGEVDVHEDRYPALRAAFQNTTWPVRQALDALLAAKR